MDDYGANVVLTADTSQYDQSLNQSAQNTDALGKSIDTLGNKLQSLSKRAGKTFLGISAADTATIVATTAAYAAFEKQMTSLNAQVAVLNKSTADQKRQMTDYANQVNTIRRSFGETTANAAQLVQTISKMSDMTKAPQALANTFAKMGEATQESSTRLATSMLQLQRTMGTPQRDTEKFANQLTVLQARSNASATSILDFANSIAPVGRLVNMTQTDIMGFSNAFIKAGQDGYQASNVFNKMLSDISYATQSGSPELAKYANLVGMTTQSFKELGGTNQILSIFDAINRQGPAAITTLNRMGYDGMRTVRTITAMSQQSGGLGNELNAARNADPDAMNRGSAQAMTGIVDSLKRLRAELNQTAESFGKNFAPAADGFITAMTKMMGVARVLVDSPLGKLAALFAGIAAPLGVVVGSALLASKALTTFAAARMALTGAFASGLRETRALGPVQRAAMAEMGVLPGVGGTRAVAGEQGRDIMRRGSWTNRLFYNRGADLGRFVGPYGEGPGLMSRGIGYGTTGVGWFNRNILMPQFGAGAVRIPGVEGTGGYNSVAERMRFFNSRTLMGSMGGEPGGFWNRQATGFRQGLAGINNPAAAAAASHDLNRMYTEAYAMNKRLGQTSGSGMGGAVRMADAEKYAQNVLKSSRGLEDLTKSTMSARQGIGNMAGSFARLATVIGATGVGAVRYGAGVAGRLGSEAINGLGIPPVMLAMMAGYGAFKGIQAMNDIGNPRYENTSGFANPYIQAGGGTPPPTANLIGASKSAALTVGQATRVSPTDALAGRDTSHKLTNSQLHGLTLPQAIARMKPSMSFLRDNPQSLQSLKLDLIDKFGPSQAESAMRQLMSVSDSQSTDISSFMNPALDPGKEHFFSRNASAEKSMGYLNQLGGTYSDQLNASFAAGGTNLAQATRGDQLSQLLGEYARGTSGKNRKQTKGQRVALNKFLFAQFFGIDISDKEAQDLAAPSGNMSNTDALTQYLKNIADRSHAGPYGGYLPTGTQITESQMNAMASTLGLDPNLINRSNFGTKASGALLSPVQTSDANTLENRLARMRSGNVFGLTSVQEAIGPKAGDPATQYQGATDLFRQMRSQGLSPQQIQKRLGNFLGTIGDDNDQRSQLVMLAQQFNNRNYAARMPTMSREDQFSAQTSMFRSTMQQNIGGSQANLSARQGAIDTFTQQVEEQRQYFQQMLYQQREFDVSRQRAEQDFNLQRQYAQSDFARQRARAEQDYNIMRQRAEADFARQMGRNRKDFNLSRRREDQDHNHQVMLMIEQQAKAMYNMYDRVKVQRTDSATWLLRNSQDQTQRMQQQEANLTKLRGMGLSDNAIQQMGLTDSNNAQQLARFVSEVAGNPELVKKFNKEVSDRLKSAAKLVKDDSSTEWEEFQRSYKLSRNRAQDDFEKSVKRAREDFKRNLSQQDDDFQRSLKRQNQDFGISMNRSEDAFRLSMNRSAADLARSAETIDGNFENILEKAVKNLGGHAGKMAKTVLSEFRALKGTAGAESADIMQVIADIFGVDYTPPKGALKAANVVSNKDGTFHVKGTKNIFQASGGVLPGFTPGVDVHHFSSPDGQQLHLSGGEAVMVPEWTKKVGGPGAVAEMNRRARSGYAKGGVYWPVPGHETGTYPGHDGVDINRGSGWDDYGDPIRAFRAGKISYVGTGHGYGDAIFERGPGYGTVVYGHTSKTYVHPGQMVAAGQLIGRVGNTGHATAPHLHFGQPGGTTAGALALLAGALPGGFGNLSDGGLGQMMQSWNSVKKKYYPHSEAAAAVMSAVHPLQHGMISAVMNRFGKQAYNNYKDKYGASFADAPGGAVGGGTNLDATGGNQDIVKKYMRQFGWNQWPSLYQLVQHESGFRNTAQNPTSSAYGMFQFLNSTWGGVGGHKTSDPNLQALYGMRYIQDRYHDPNGAWNFWQGHHWYGDGAILTKPQMIAAGERGPEALIPLNDKGTDFMAGLLQRFMPGTEAKQGNVRYSTPAASTHNEYHYRIDRSTTFSGAIQVMANNPNEFLAQLQAKQRVAALSQPSLGGMR